MTDYRPPRETLSFILIAVILMVVIHFFIFPDYQARLHSPFEEEEVLEAEDVPQLSPEIELETPELPTFEDIPLIRAEPELIIKTPPPSPPLWQENAVSVDVPEETPKIVIIIDDVGMDRRHSEEVIGLPFPLTLAFLPYAPDVKSLVEEARRTGHEIMVHMPMEPMNPDLDTGGIVLRHDQSPEEFAQMLDEGLSAFDGYVGLNNHMGSRLTQDEAAMDRLMAELKTRGLLFVDSRTIASTVAFDVAAEHGVPHAERDVFLDHDASLEAVRASLRRLERIAISHGTAIAIGHPRAHTIEGLREWLPMLKEKGIMLVPVSNVVVTDPASPLASE